MTKKEIADHLQMIEKNLTQLRKQTDALMFRVIKCETINENLKQEPEETAEKVDHITMAPYRWDPYQGPTVLEVLHRTNAALDKFEKEIQKIECRRIKSKLYKKFTKRIIV